MNRFVLIGAVAMLPTVGAATPFELIYTGSLSADESLIGPDGVDLIDSTTRFQVRARFDTGSPDLSIPPLPGWVSYAPTQASIVINGVGYSIVGYNEDPLFGVTVDIFDPTNVFNPGLYGVGLFANPIEDGAGFVGDFSGTEPALFVDALQATVFTDYNGAGFLPGVGCFPPGNPACTFQPWILRDSNGAEFSLGFGFRQEEVADGAPLATARIIAVPEAGSLGLFGVGLLAFGLARRRSPN